MDFLVNMSNGFGGITTSTLLSYGGFFAILVYVIVTLSLVYHWWRYTFEGDVFVLPAAIVYGIGSVTLLLVIIASL